MASDLVELHERVEWARGEIQTLKDECRAFCRQAFKTWIDHDADGSFALSAQQTKPVPTSIKSRGGTIANELRSCLDGLACQLAIRNGETPADVYFPISKHKSVFESDGLKRKLRKLSATDRDTIAALRPYREANEALFGLHEADRTRKHQRLIASTGGASVLLNGRHLNPRFGNAEFFECTINGVNVPYLATPGGRLITDVGVTFEIARGAGFTAPIEAVFALAYSEPDELRGQIITVSLRHFADTVDGIIGLFD